MNDKAIDQIVADIMSLDENQDMLPIITADGKEALVSVTEMKKAIGQQSLKEGEISPVILGSQIIFEHRDANTGNRYVFYTNDRVITAFDLTVCVMNDANRLIKRGVVNMLCAESFAFAQMMERLYRDYSFAFAYPATTRVLNMAKAGLTGEEINDAGWEPLLDEHKVSKNVELGIKE